MKQYVKENDGKYRLVDTRDQKVETKATKAPSLEELDVRLKRVERIVVDPKE